MSSKPISNGDTASPPDPYATHFTLANLPYGVVSLPSTPQKHQIATCLGSTVYILPSLLQCPHNHLTSPSPEANDALQQPTLNAFAALPRSTHVDVRTQLHSLLSQHAPDLATCPCRAAHHVSTVQCHLPLDIPDFTDFSSSRDHVLNAGEAATGVRRLPNSFLHQPVGYAGRVSSIVISGTSIRRPRGNYFSPKRDGSVVYGLSQKVDFELEVACVIGRPSAFGEPVDVNEADGHVFGFVLLNDWSARDIQGLEMDPLGPLNGKSFGTSISPWVVTVDALGPFEVAGPQKDLPNAPYLDDRKVKNAYDVNLKVELVAGETTSTVCESNLQCIYWTFRDMVAHQTVNGCPLRTGDMLATGTVSGPTEGSLGCLMESSRKGMPPINLADGSSRTYLENCDAVRLTGWAGELGSPECVGFGESFGTLIEAKY